jgi:hypothetical protein
MDRLLRRPAATRNVELELRTTAQLSIYRIACRDCFRAGKLLRALYIRSSIGQVASLWPSVVGALHSMHQVDACCSIGVHRSVWRAIRDCLFFFVVPSPYTPIYMVHDFRRLYVYAKLKLMCT